MQVGSVVDAIKRNLYNCYLIFIPPTKIKSCTYYRRKRDPSYFHNQDDGADIAQDVCIHYVNEGVE